MSISPKSLRILTEERKLDPELLARFGVESFTRVGIEWIRFPVFVGNERVNAKSRTIEGDKKFFQEPDGKKCFYNFNALTDSSLSDMPIIITEGEIDCLSVIQAGYQRCVSVPDGAPATPLGDKETSKYTYLQDTLKLLDGEVILAVDNDGPGINLMNDLALRIGRSQCKFIKYPWKKDRTRRCKDMNEVLCEWGTPGIVECINRAEWVSRDGVHALSEIPPQEYTPVHKIGFPVLDNHYRVREGDFCVVVGYPSHGKTSFLNDLACRMALNHKWRVAFASFEQHPQTDHKRSLMGWYLRKDAKYATQSESQTALEWIDHNFRFIIASDDQNPTLEWLLEMITKAVVQHDCKMVIVDPWNEMSHIWSDSMNKTDYIGFAIKELKRLARIYKIHLVIAAHPSKPHRDKNGKFPVPTLYDISDTANFSNKADVGVTIYRPDQTKNQTEIIVTKVRYQDTVGTPGVIKCQYLPDQRRYEATETEAPIPLKGLEDYL